MSTPEQRRVLLHAAIEILQRDGAAALTVRNVAAAAGCSTTGVYTYFGGKDGLVDAIFRDGFERFDAALEAAGHRSDPMAHLRATGEAYRAWGLANPTQYQVMFTRAVPGFLATPDSLARARRSFDALVERVQRAIDAGGLAPHDATSTAMHMWATLHGYVMLELMGIHPPTVPPPASLYSAGLTRLLDGLRPR